MKLATESPFQLGCLRVEPSTCTVSGGGGARVLQPRVMEVLVTLWRAQGGVVSRETLIHECWADRIVGEDAITRVMVKLRRLSLEQGGGSFELITIPRVGYRLTAGGEAQPARGRAAGLPRRELIGLGVSGGLAAAIGGWLAWRRAQPTAAPPSEPLVLAVLPFDDLSPQPQDSYLASGLARELRNTLSRVGGLRVVAASSSMPVAQAGAPPRLSPRVDAALLLSGSITRNGGLVRVSLELTDPKAGTQVWSQTQDRPAKDIFKVLDGASDAALAAVSGRVAPSETQPPPPLRSRDPQAFQWVMEAEDLVEQSRALRMKGREGEGEDAAERAWDLAGKALDIDGGDVRALLVRAIITRNGWTRALGREPLSQAQRAAASVAIIRQALRSDPNDPAALTALGDYYRRFEWRWTEAENLFRRAIIANPSLVEARWSYAYELGVLGRGLEGLAQAREVARLDPEDLWRRLALARLLYTAGQRDAALVRYDAELAADRANAFLVREIYLMHLAEGNAGALRRLLDKLRAPGPPPPGPVVALLVRTEAAIAALRGSPGPLMELVDADVAGFDAQGSATSQGRASVDLLYIYAIEYAWAGRTERAIMLLQRALAAGSLYWPATLPYGPAEFPPAVRADPRYQALWRTDQRVVQLVESRRKASLAGQLAKPWRRGPDWRD